MKASSQVSMFKFTSETIPVRNILNYFTEKPFEHTEFIRILWLKRLLVNYDRPVDVFIREIDMINFIVIIKLFECLSVLYNERPKNGGAMLSVVTLDRNIHRLFDKLLVCRSAVGYDTNGGY